MNKKGVYVYVLLFLLVLAPTANAQEGWWASLQDMFSSWFSGDKITGHVVDEQAQIEENATEQPVDQTIDETAETQTQEPNVTEELIEATQDALDSAPPMEGEPTTQEQELVEQIQQTIDTLTDEPDPAELVQMFHPSISISSPRQVSTPITLTHTPEDAIATYFLTINGITTELPSNTFTPEVNGPHTISALMEWKGISKTLLEQFFVEQPPVQESPVTQEQSTQEVHEELNPIADYQLTVEGETMIGNRVTFPVQPAAKDVQYVLRVGEMVTKLSVAAYTLTVEGEHTITAIVETQGGTVILERTFTVKNKLVEQQIEQVIQEQKQLPQFSTELVDNEIHHNATFTGPLSISIPEDAFDLSIAFVDPAFQALGEHKVLTPVEMPILVDGQRIGVSEFNDVRAEELENGETLLNTITGNAIHSNDEDGIITRFLHAIVRYLAQGNSPTGLVIGTNGVADGIQIDLGKGLFEVRFSTRSNVLKVRTPPAAKNICSFPEGEDIIIASMLTCENSLLKTDRLHIKNGATLYLINTTVESRQTRIDGRLFSASEELDYILQNGPMTVGETGVLLLKNTKVYFNVTEDREFGVDVHTGGKIQMGGSSAINNAAPLGGLDHTFLLAFDVKEYALG